MNLVIAGIHTGIGKTVCSAVICQALGYDYWKPVQAGDLENSDSVFVKKMVTNPRCHIHPERYKLRIAASPHYAAEQENLTIRREDFTIPETENSMVIETAGGLMSPLATEFLNIDLVEQFALPVVLVSQNYLGSINHTLLSVEALKARRLPVAGLVFCGDSVPATETFILKHSGLPLLFRIPHFDELSPVTLSEYVKNITINL